jgi:hypothetical protein
MSSPLARVAGLVVYLLTALLGFGCSTGSGATSYLDPTTGEVPAAAAFRAPAPLTESLFKDDQAVISNEDIAKILSAKVELPSGAKLAAVRFGQMPYWWGWSEDFVRMNRQIDRDFLDRLGQTKRLEEVAYLPTLVTPTQMTIPYLRQAAARCQADLLLIYRTSTHSYDRQRLFSAGETKAYCTVEAVVLDTRTGTIPFSTVVTETFAARKGSGDIDFTETVARANQQAIGKAWLSLADEVKTFFDDLPAPAPAAAAATDTDGGT